MKNTESEEEPDTPAKTTKKAAQIKAVFTTCTCKNKKEAQNKLDGAKKNELKDQKLLV